MVQIQQGTAYTREFLMVSSGNHITGQTGAAPTVSLSKAGGAFAGAAGVVAEIGNGFYSVALTGVDTNTLGDLGVHATGTGADPTDWIDEIVAFKPSQQDPLSAQVPGGYVAGSAGYSLGTVPWGTG